MTQTETVLVPQTLEELQNAKVKDLRAIVAVLKTEDTDCLPKITVKSKKDEMITALAEYMGFNETDDEESAVTEEVNKEITEEVETQSAEEEIQLDTLDLFGPQPTEVVEVTGEVGQLGVITGNEEVDSVLAELGLDDGQAVNMDDILFDQNPEALAEQVDKENSEMAQVLADFKAEQAEEKPKKKRAGAIPMDAPIPVRNFRNLILGIYGNVLEPLEEKDEQGFEYYELKLERFNSKSHETFRKTKGNMNLLYTRGGGTYLIVHELPTGEFEPVLEVSNKGRGHLRCKQLANVLQVAYNEKDDQKIIEDTLYQELVGKIELMEIKWEGLGA